MEDALIVMIVLFTVIVAPIWLLLHYGTRWKATKTLSSEETRMLEDVWRTAETMENRIKVLETILDAEAPGWRDAQ